MATFEQTVARRMRHLRERQGMTQADLAGKMFALGLEVDRSAIARMETGRRRISLEEALYLAWALSVAPVHLLVDPNSDEMVSIGRIQIENEEEPRSKRKGRDKSRKSLEMSPDNARRWIRGEVPIWSQDQRIYLSEAPADEFGARVQQSLPPSEEGQRWMQLDTDAIAGQPDLNEAQKLAGLRALQEGAIEQGDRAGEAAAEKETER